MLTFNFSKTNSKSVETTTFPSELPLNLDNRSGTGTFTVPAHAFLPVPKGSIVTTDSLGLYENDVRIPAQFEVAQQWDTSGNLPKWIHVHFLAVYVNGVPRAYKLKKETLPDSPPSTNLSYTDVGGLITVQNGYVKIEVSKTAFCGPQKIWFDPTGAGSYGSPILNSTNGGPIYVGAAERNWLPKYDASAVVQVEESGPMKITILAKGYFTTPFTNPNRHMRNMNRITIYANTPRIFFQQGYTFGPRHYTVSYVSPLYIKPATGVCQQVYDLKYSLPFDNISNYYIGVDGSTITDTMPTFVDNTPPTDIFSKLVAWWPLSDTDPDFRNDVVGESHFSATNVSSVAGVVGNATRISGIASASNLWNAGRDTIMCDLGGTNSFAFSVWVKLHSKGSASASIVNKYTQNQNGYGETNRTLRISHIQSSDRFAFECVNESGVSTQVLANNLGSPALETWYHIVAQYESVGKTLSITVNNGTPNTATLTGTGLRHSYEQIVMGNISNNGAPVTTGLTGYGLNADVALLGFWNGRTLSGSEISFLYNSGAGRDYPFGLTPPTETVNTTVAYMHQYKHDAVRLLGAAAPHDTSSLEKSDNWSAVTTSNNVRISLLTKKVWQRYPKEIELSKNGIAYHSWPKNGTDAFALDDEISPENFHKFLHYHQHKRLNPQFPYHYVNMAHVGPGKIISNINTSTNVVTTTRPHGWLTTQKIQFLRGTPSSVLPTGIDDNSYLFNLAEDYVSGGTNYYINKIDDTSFYVYNSSANAQAGGVTGRIDFTDTGSGLLYVGTTDYRSEAIAAENWPRQTYITGMHGVTIFDEFSILLSSTGNSVNHVVEQSFYENKPIAYPDGSWRNYYNSLGSVGARTANFSELEDAYEKTLTGYFNPEKTLDYGMFNYGDGHHQWWPSKNRASLSRNWLSSHYYIIEMLWAMYYHNPTQALLDQVRTMHDHYANVDTGRFENAQQLSGYPSIGYGHGKNLVHWGTTTLYGHWGDSDGMLFGWLIDANRWYKNTYEDHYSSTFANAYPPINFASNLNAWREYSCPLKKVCTLFEHTKDVRLLPAIHILGNVAGSVTANDGVGIGANTLPNTGTHFHPLWGTHYFETTRDPVYDGLTGVAKYAGQNIAQYRGDDATSLGFANGLMAAWAKAYEVSSDTSYLTLALHRFANLKNYIADLPANPYDGFGLGPGPLGDGHIPWMWTIFSKQLEKAGITSLPDPTTASDHWGAYPTTSSSIWGDDARNTIIYVYKSTANIPWTFNIRSYSPVVGDIHPMGITVKDSTNTTLYAIGEKSYYQPQQGTGPWFNITLDPNTDIFTVVSGGPASDGITKWNDLQFVQIIPRSGQTGTDITMPVSTPQVEPYTNYYIKFLTSSAAANATFKLYTTPQDAYNNTNPIQFSTAGSNLGMQPRGDRILTPQYDTLSNTFHIYPGGAAGLVAIRVAGFAAGVMQPFTNMPECVVVRNSRVVPGVGSTGPKITSTKGYLVPLQSYPITITVSTFWEEYVTNVLIKDADGDVVVDTSLVNGINSSVSAIINNADGKPAPWYIEISTRIGCSLTFDPVGGQTDPYLFLYGKDVDEINLIKTALGW